MQRKLARELLDELPAEDPRAIASRRDLRRINSWMGNPRTLANALESLSTAERGNRRLVELGAGDGTLMLKVARRLGPAWAGSTLVTVDRLTLVTNHTCSQFEELGWKVTTEAAEIFEWLSRPHQETKDIMIGNLILHHFGDSELRNLLGLVADSCGVFIALEPRRAPLSLLLSRLVRLIGCNQVTRHDAVVSVRAGFKGRELSGLWPEGPWFVQEFSRGHSSHVLLARRMPL